MTGNGLTPEERAQAVGYALAVVSLLRGIDKAPLRRAALAHAAAMLGDDLAPEPIPVAAATIVRMSPEDALSLARWILDAFGDPCPHDAA